VIHLYHYGNGILVYTKMKITDEVSRLLQSVHNENRSEFRKMNERLTSIEKSLHADVIRKEIQDTKAQFQPDETALINYVRNNPGQSKNKIIEVFEKGGYNGITRSRKITLEKINELAKEYDIFKFQADSKHRQRQCVYINDQSFLLNINKILDDFKEALMVAAKVVHRKVVEDRSAREPKNGDSSHPRFSVYYAASYYYYNAIVTSYQHFVSMIMLQAVFDWPQIANNNTHTLKRAYQILFVKLNGIQQALKDTLGKTDVDVRASLVSASWFMRPSIMLEGYRSAEKLNILPQLKQLYTAAWTVSQNDFDRVDAWFTPDSLLKYNDNSTISSLSFGDKSVTWEKALEPGLEELKKGVQVSYEFPFGKRVGFKTKDGKVGYWAL
jgi:hypothetical protein